MFFPNTNKQVNNDKLYKVLGISKNASESEIKKAYKKLALKYHPDKNSGDDTQFKKINEAYEILSDQEKKQMYDQFGEEYLKPDFQNNQHHFNPNDIFEQFFKPQQRTNFSHHNKGKDLIHNIELSLEEIYIGITKKMAINRDIICSECKGIGCKDKNKIQKCSDCNGQGIKTIERQLQPGMVQQIRTKCTKCNGQGNIITNENKCTKCNGNKTIKDRQIKEIVIHKGIENGETIIFSGQADEVPGKLPGDIIFIIKEKKHPIFKRKGTHLLMKQEIGLNEALCGFKFKIKHLDGRYIYIESNSNDIINPNDFKAVPNLGMPNKKNDGYGHLAILFKVKFPDELSKTQKKVLINLFNYKYPDTKDKETKKICNVYDVEFNEPVNKMIYTDETKEAYRCNIM